MSEHVEVLTLLFADICHSTRIIQEHGDQVAHELIQRGLACVEQCARAHGGEIRGQIGDELMCTFPEPSDAIRTALEIGPSIRAGRHAGDPLAELRMHMGLHHGPILIEGDQIFGDTIHIAKRMVDLAKTEQILTTEATLSAAGPMPEMRVRLADKIRIKGYDDPVAIYEVLQQDPGVTLVAQAVPPLPSAEHYARCRLSYGQRGFILNASSPFFSIGREAGNDLVIPESCVSRQHGRLEYQKGRVIFIDQSTNGTIVLEGNELAPVIVHREQRWLRGRGLLRFGQRDDTDGHLTLSYACEEASGRPQPV